MNEDRPKYFLIAIFQAGISPFEILSRIPYLDPGVFLMSYDNMFATFTLGCFIFPKTLKVIFYKNNAKPSILT